MKCFRVTIAIILGLLVISCGKSEESTSAPTESVQAKSPAASRPDCLLLDRPDALKVIFFPRRDPHPERTDQFDVFIPVAENVRLGGRLHIAEKDSPVILLFHGNGEVAVDYDFYSAFYKEIGVSTLVVDYRGYGKSEGTPTASTLLNDATAVYQQARDILSERGLDDSRLFIMGRSLGSAAAIEAASHAGGAISGLIIESGFASARPFIEEPLTEDMKEGVSGFDNAEKMKRLDVPTLIIHGGADRIIPVGDAHILFDSCRAAQKRLVIIPNAGHNDLIFRGKDLYFSAFRDFVSG